MRAVLPGLADEVRRAGLHGTGARKNDARRGQHEDALSLHGYKLSLGLSQQLAMSRGRETARMPPHVLGRETEIS